MCGWSNTVTVLSHTQIHSEWPVFRKHTWLQCRCVITSFHGDRPKHLHICFPLLQMSCPPPQKKKHTHTRDMDTTSVVKLDAEVRDILNECPVRQASVSQLIHIKLRLLSSYGQAEVSWRVKHLANRDTLSATYKRRQGSKVNAFQFTSLVQKTGTSSRTWPRVSIRKDASRFLWHSRWESRFRSMRKSWLLTLFSIREPRHIDKFKSRLVFSVLQNFCWTLLKISMLYVFTFGLDSLFSTPNRKDDLMSRKSELLRL